MGIRKNQAPDLPPLTDAQLEIMKSIWSREEATVTDVWGDLTAQRSVARNTVLTVMDRLEKRGWLKKRRIGNTFLYTAVASLDQTMGQVVRRLVDTAFSGAADRLVMALLDGRGLSDEESNRIAKMIDERRKEDRRQ